MLCKLTLNQHLCIRPIHPRPANRLAHHISPIHELILAVHIHSDTCLSRHVQNDLALGGRVKGHLQDRGTLHDDQEVALALHG